MTGLERRMQVLLSSELHERLEAEAKRCGSSVGAVVRQAVEARLDGHAASRGAAAQRLLARVTAIEQPPEDDWADIKAGFVRDLAVRFP